MRQDVTNLECVHAFADNEVALLDAHDSEDLLVNVEERAKEKDMCTSCAAFLQSHCLSLRVLHMQNLDLIRQDQSACVSTILSLLVKT